ncbi:tryptophan-rich sensory protein [Nakamurella deserti]|uniref:tryptophan-rich sensory protein n=1 Tax=Nakamurella deserti TaxID=2164074 RepID=UPI000DBE2035|nr:tryptophan-rich sensory protein [Nakamurella deserti]
MNSDRTRQITVTASEIVCVFGTLLGVGVFGGTQVDRAAGGALSADATLIAPGTQAFSIWSVIYAGLAAYTVWQWLPGQATAERHRRIGYLAAASMLLNAGWLLVVQAGWLWVSVLVILALVLVLGVIISRLAAAPSRSVVDTVITDGTFGLYVGWVSVATAANVTATLQDAGLDPSEGVAEALTVAVLAVAAGIGVLLSRVSRGNLGIGAAMVWGISWIAIARATAAPESTVVAVGAVVAAVVVAVAFVAARVQATSGRRALTRV